MSLEANDKKGVVLVGALAESKDLYAKYDENHDRSWSDKLPSDLEEAAENKDTLKYAVIIRKMKPKEADSTKPLVIDSIVIQSPYIKRALGKILEGFPGVITELSRLTINAPFACFIHRWDRFEAAVEDKGNDDITKQHLGLLYRILHDELGDLITLRADYIRNRAVTFEHLWTVFHPGCTVWGSCNGRPAALMFHTGRYFKTQCGPIYTLACSYGEWNGSSTGWAHIKQTIPEFQGTMSFTDLPSFPLEYHPQVDAAKRMLVERGRRWEGLVGYHYKAYKGIALWHDDEKTYKEYVESRIVIDGKNWVKNNRDDSVDLDVVEWQEDEASADSTPYPDDARWMAADDDAKMAPLTEKQLLMASPVVRGYALKNKRWMEFFVDDVAEIAFNERAFDSLVLPADHKELILAFAQSQVRYKHAFDDVIAGKGRGIIMLLAGGPGIGKTLTAESVAEQMHVPLYTMSAGDLGADAGEVDDRLQAILDMVGRWNAVLLLDECDVFLEERSAHDMERNRIVSIFLRTLEYYEGILFLTTNRVRNMDPAFQSRIHMALQYPALDASSREAVWRGFLARALSHDAVASSSTASAPEQGTATHEVAEDEIRALAGLELNGRQIKNVLKMANLLACNKQEKLAYGHLRTVLKVGGHSL